MSIIGRRLVVTIVLTIATAVMALVTTPAATALIAGPGGCCP